MTISGYSTTNTYSSELKGGLSRSEAAAYVGVAPATFDKLVGAGEMPAPRIFKSINRKLCYKPKIDIALASDTTLLKSSLDERYA